MLYICECVWCVHIIFIYIYVCVRVYIIYIIMLYQSARPLVLSPSRATQFQSAPPLRQNNPQYNTAPPYSAQRPYSAYTDGYRPPHGRRLPQPFYDRPPPPDQYGEEYPNRQISPTPSTGSTSPRRLTLRRQDRIRGSAESIVGKVRI